MQEKKYKIALLNLSKNLRKLRIENNKTQAEVSIEMNIDTRLYQRLESNKVPDIRFSTLFKIFEYYNIPLKDLLK